MCDNKIVVSAFKHDGVRDHVFSRHLKRIYRYCRKMNIHLQVEWVSTHVQQADEPSRSCHLSDSRLRYHIRTALKCSFNINIDLAASAENTITRQFVCRDQHPDAYASDCMSLFESHVEFSVNEPLKYQPERSHQHLRPYCYPPKVLQRPVINHLVPRFNTFIFIYNSVKDLDLTYSLAMKKFDYYIEIGNSQFPAVITPCKRYNGHKETKLITEPYYRVNKEIGCTYMFIKGHTLEEMQKFQYYMRHHCFHRNSLAKAHIKFLQLLTHDDTSLWTNQRFTRSFEIRECQ